VITVRDVSEREAEEGSMSSSSVQGFAEKWREN